MDMTQQEAERFFRKLGGNLKGELEKLKRQMTESFRGREEFLEVVTAVEALENLLPLETDDSIFFANQPPFGKGEPRTLPSGLFFLRVPYEEFQSLLGRDFTGAGFKYQLKPNCRLVAEEEKFQRIARLYDVPLRVYSPYARRAVDICIFGEPSEPFDLRLAENNLAGKLLLNKGLYLNAEISPARWDSEVMDGRFYEYRCSADSDRTFVLPCADSSFDEGVEIHRVDAQIVFRTPRELPSEKCERIKILPAPNKIAARILNKKRLRTQGDIEFVLSGLKRDEYSCHFGRFGDAGGNIVRYSKGHEYFSAADENLLQAKSRLPICTVKFVGEGIFLTDYANFVLQLLEEYYPEFNWAGERDE